MPKIDSQFVSDQLASVDGAGGKVERDREEEHNKRRKELQVDLKAKSEEIAWKKYTKVLSGKRETDAVIRSIAEGLVVVDDKGNVVMMNPAAEQPLDSSKKDKIGTPILEKLNWSER